jgi:hypothetical protein
VSVFRRTLLALLAPGVLAAQQRLVVIDQDGTGPGGGLGR